MVTQKGDSRLGKSPPVVVAEFEELEPQVYVANLTASEPDTRFEAFKRQLFGAPISEVLAGRERLNRFRALAILSSDALSSVAYGTEASLSILIAAGVAAFTINLWIGLCIALLMLIVANSYHQTIEAYPSGGGSYIVARSNLGTFPGLIAAAALLVDYLLTVSVSVASGIDAIASALPGLTPYKVAIDLGAILLITLINLRGVRETGTIFAFPTYLFLSSFGLMIIFAFVKILFHGGLFTPIPPHPTVFPGHVQPINLMLILTAFASGCSAMTGVEAISNGVQAFNGDSPKEQSRNANSTLRIMILLLVTFFLSTTYLAWRIGAAPVRGSNPTVTAQIAHFAYSGWSGWLFYVVQVATLLILVFAANTSFNGFPRLAAILARDSFMPALFMYRGERMAFNVGIGTLGILSAIVLYIFQGNVIDLINLYALGVFTAFTLSQTGMVVHWLRHKEVQGWQQRLASNGVGALATFVVTIVIGVAKFDRGAWVVVVLVPLMSLGFLGVRHYYRMPRFLHTSQVHIPKKYAFVIVPILSHKRVMVPEPLRHEFHLNSWPSIVREELDFAATFADQIVVTRVVNDQQEAEAIQQELGETIATETQRLGKPVRLETIISPYRTIVLPLANFIRWQCEHEFQDQDIAVVLPRQTHSAFWEWPLKRRVAERLRTELLRDQKLHKLSVIDLPFSLGH